MVDYLNARSAGRRRTGTHPRDAGTPLFRELMRRNEAEYRALGLDDERLGHAELIRAMRAHPAPDRPSHRWSPTEGRHRQTTESVLDVL
ncbi:ArsC/Spx/MgsR family protein [Dokdonella sp.]|uniref:ArsC/Spx/MgsR family protein n=1 Tax=Dokdonella sp. TaxID=2291710 RepID=UPI0035282618